MSLGRLYELFGNRDQLMATAMEQWMATHVYASLSPLDPALGVYDGVMEVLRTIFEPWERNPRMLEAFHKARLGERRALLEVQGREQIGPVLPRAFDGADPTYTDDAMLILTHLLYRERRRRPRRVWRALFAWDLLR